MPDPASPSSADRFARVLGAATAVYAAATLVRPLILSGPAGLRSSPSTDVLVRAVGARDLASGTAIAVAPPGLPRQLALLVRIASDLGDLLTFATADVPAAGKRKAVAVSAMWAGLNVAALLAQDR